MSIQSIRGMHDLFGEEMAQWSHVEKRLLQVLRDFGYTEIRTPVLEKVEVFTQAVGEDTDIVEKQMYTLEVGDDRLALRPEGTGAFMRAVIQHQLNRAGGTQRFFYYCPMYRHERPQKGRLRQFFQIGAELINDESPEADVELISLLHQMYRSLDLDHYEICINSVGCQECRPGYRDQLLAYFKPYLADLCSNCQKRYERAPMRILDCKKEGCQKLAREAPLIVEHLCEGCRRHHAKVHDRLRGAKIPFKDDPHIVRGLDYYCRTAFEFVSDLLGAQSALGAGGRYDGLSERFGEKPIPGVGWALGMERLLLALEAKDLLKGKNVAPSYYFVALGEPASSVLFPLSLSLKAKGIQTEMGYDSSRSLKAQLKSANRADAAFTLVVGEQELSAKKAILKDMKLGSQTELSLDGIEDELIRRLADVSK